LAADRRPDVVHKNPDAARVLNIEATAKVASACRRCGAWLIFISTDYIFDGTEPPYTVDAVPNPLSAYGTQKLEGERNVLQDPSAAVLRVPIMFGPAEFWKESAVTTLYDDLLNGMTKADHVQKRYPTFTVDIARVIQKMLEVHCGGEKLCGIFHWQGNECLTKFDMVQTIARLEGIDASAVLADVSEPKFPRPHDSRLDCTRLTQELQIDPAHFRTSFQEALRTVFARGRVDAQLSTSASSKPPVASTIEPPKTTANHNSATGAMQLIEKASMPKRHRGMANKPNTGDPEAAVRFSSTSSTDIGPASEYSPVGYSDPWFVDSDVDDCPAACS
jgi:dTDP-4-dehydrorhamnose reductase